MHTRANAQCYVPICAISYLLTPHSPLCVYTAQLGKLQADMEALREQRESTICTTREELYLAQEEVPLLLHTLTPSQNDS